MGFAVRLDNRVKIKEKKERDKYLDFVRELRKLCNTKVTVILVVIGKLGKSGKEAERVGNRMTNRNHPDFIIVEIGKNAGKNY